MGEGVCPLWKRIALKPQMYEMMICESFVLFIETIKLNMAKIIIKKYFQEKYKKLSLKKWIRIHFFNPLLTWYKKIIPLTWHAISTCLSAGLCFFSAENILFISYAHLKYPIQQRYNINKQTAAGSWLILLLFSIFFRARLIFDENSISKNKKIFFSTKKFILKSAVG